MNMELHKALQHIIQTDGVEMLSNLKIINILDDFNAYDDIAASKYILRSIIVDGCMTKFLSIGKWDNNAILLINKFHTSTGFKEEAVNDIFRSIAYALGWITNYKPLGSQSKNIQKNQDISLIPDSQFSQLTKKQQEDYITKLITVDSNIENIVGISIKGNIGIGGGVTLWVNVEASGKLRQKNDISVFVAVYDRDGNLKELRKVMKFDNNPILSPICCSRVFFDGFLKAGNSGKCFLCNISKILIYAERDLY